MKHFSCKFSKFIFLALISQLHFGLNQVSLAGETPFQLSGGTLTDEEIEKIFKSLKEDDFNFRWNNIQVLLWLEEDSLPVLRRRLERPQKASGESMKRIIYSLRKQLKDEKIARLEAKGKKVDPEKIELESPVEFLKILVERKRNDNLLAWRGAVEIMSILVGLYSIGSTNAFLNLIDFSSAYESAFRKEIYQMLISAGEKALPSVLLRKNSKDENIQVVVNSYLSKMNMIRPAEQVQVKDPSVLVEVLRIFALSKDFNTMDVITHFLNAENPVVRKAAREAIMSFGKNAIWALRNEYRNYTGQEASGAWSAEEIAKELFKLQDSDRLAPMEQKMKEGLEFARKRNFEKMEEIFREILAQMPMYERKSEMVPAYMEAARYYADRGKYERASYLIRIARRLNEDYEKAKKIIAFLYYVEALHSLQEGIADPELMKEALKLDPDLKDAKVKLKDIENIFLSRKVKGYRLAAAAGIALTALLILIIILVKKF